MSKLLFASVISEIQQSDVFMTVKARICETPAANLNGARVTDAFIDEIVANAKRYVGLPLYADVKALTSGNYTRLGHLYDSRTGEFHSTQIGSFYKFEKEEFEGGSYLVGYARIPKRNKKLSRAISELFTENALKFSFEISVGEYEELDDQTILIDASENNYLEGTAIVTFPACEDAVALELVAQKADDAEGGEKEMADVQKPAEELAEQAETEATEIASTEPEAAKVPETETAEKAEEVTAETETAEEAEENHEVAAEEETAAVVVREAHYEDHTVNAYDTETGKEVRQSISVVTETIDRQEGQIVQATDGIHIAADNDPPANSNDDPEEGSEDEPSEAPAPDLTPDDQPKKKTAEEMFAELAESIRALTEEVNALKEVKHAVASTVTAETVNPFIGDLDAKNKYSLLESVSSGRVTLLDP